MYISIKLVNCVYRYVKIDKNSVYMHGHNFFTLWATTDLMIGSTLCRIETADISGTEDFGIYANVCDLECVFVVENFYARKLNNSSNRTITYVLTYVHSSNLYNLSRALMKSF